MHYVKPTAQQNQLVADHNRPDIRQNAPLRIAESRVAMLARDELLEICSRLPVQQLGTALTGQTHDDVGLIEVCVC